MTITLRSVKGSALTYTELDNNFIDLDGRTTALEGSGAQNPIDSITIAGNVLTFNYTSSFGGGSDSVTIPTLAWTDRGPWQASRLYDVNDLVTDSNRLYLVNIQHTSASTFDPGLQIGGHDVYSLLLGPLGVTTSAELNDATYTLAVTDVLKYYRCTATSGVVITIPSSGDVDIALDAEISFRQCSDSIIFEATSGVTLNVPDGFDPNTDHIGAVVTLKKVDTDEWDIFGALAATSA